MAYERIEPWGEERADWRAGMVSATIANVHRKKGTKAKQPEDFMPKFAHEKKPQSVEEQIAIVQQIRAAVREKKGRLEQKRAKRKARLERRENSGNDSKPGRDAHGEHSQLQPRVPGV